MGSCEGPYLDWAARHWHSPMAPLFGEFRLKPLEAVSQRPGGESALRYWQGGSRAPATATGSQCTLSGFSFSRRRGARRPPQEGGAPDVGWIWSMFGAFGLQAVPPTRGGQPKVLSWMFGAPQGLQPSPPAGGGRAKVLFRDTGLRPPPRGF